MQSLTVAEQARALEDHTAAIHQLKKRMARDFYDLGTRLVAVRDQRLWQAADFVSFDDYLKRGAGIGRNTAYRYMRVVEHFNAEIAARYGIEKLDAVRAWIEATPAEELPGDALAASIRVRGDDGRFQRIPLHDATADEIRQAVALLREAKAGGQRVPTALTQWAEEVATALPTTFRSRNGIRVKRRSDGRLTLTFAEVPVDDLPSLIRELQARLDDLPR